MQNLEEGFFVFDRVKLLLPQKRQMKLRVPTFPRRELIRNFTMQHM